MPERSKILAKAKTKAAVKRKPAKTQARAVPVRVAKPAKKTVAVKPVKASAAKPAKASAAKAATSVVAEVKVVAKPPVERKAGPLTLPAAKQNAVSAAKEIAPAASPPPVVRKIAAPASARADLPPADGFTLLVDGHFKNQFEDLKGAKAAATELKSRFPMLRVEIYDAANKARLPA
jgi:hypothetical protein